jgi:hypothetical protein
MTKPVFFRGLPKHQFLHFDRDWGRLTNKIWSICSKFRKNEPIAISRSFPGFLLNFAASPKLQRLVEKRDDCGAMMKKSANFKSFWVVLSDFPINLLMNRE